MKRLTILERALLAAEEKLESSPDVIFKDVPAQHIQPLLRLTQLSEKQRIQLTVMGIDAGLAKAKDLETLYTAGATPASGGKDASATKAPDESWQKLAYFYNESRNAADSVQQWGKIFARHCL